MTGTHEGTGPAAALPSCGFIGWGAEGAALLAALERRYPGLSAAAVALPAGDQCAPLARRLPSPEALFQAAQWIFVAGTPEDLGPHLPVMRLAIADRHALVLLGGGWSLAELAESLRERKLARCTLLHTGPDALGAMAYLLSPDFAPAEREAFRDLFADLDPCVELREEGHFDVVQGLADFVPAALFTAMEAMTDGVTSTGLPRAAALRLLTALFHGAAERLLKAGGSLPDLRAQALESTAAAEGLIELESAGIRGALMRAVRQAVHRPTNPNRLWPKGPPPQRGE